MSIVKFEINILLEAVDEGLKENKLDGKFDIESIRETLGTFDKRKKGTVSKVLQILTRIKKELLTTCQSYDTFLHDFDNMKANQREENIRFLFAKLNGLLP